MIATGLAFFSLLCLIPDLKEYPYYSKLEVHPIQDEYYDIRRRKYESPLQLSSEKKKIQ